MTAERQDIRDDIITKVQRGELSPDEAEQEAARFGVGPLRERLDLSRFDPSKEAFWTVPMTVAWVMWRNYDAVRKVWDKFRLEESDWSYEEHTFVDGEKRKGYFLRTRSRASLLDLTILKQVEQSSGQPSVRMTVNDAIEEIQSRASSGELPGTGIDTRTSERMQIPDYEWHDLKVTMSVLRPSENSAAILPNGRAYTDIVFNGDQVRTCFPSEESRHLTHTGMPGRPSAQLIVETEITRRIEAGEIIGPNITAEADKLEKWQSSQTPPPAAIMHAKTIKNKFGPRLRKAIKAPHLKK